MTRWLLLVLLLPLFVLGCQRAESPEEQPSQKSDSIKEEPVEDAGDAAPGADPIVAKAGDLVVTLEAYRRSFAVAGLRGALAPSAETLASPAFQQVHARRLLKRSALRREGSSRGLRFDQTALRERYASMDGALQAESNSELEAAVLSKLGLQAEELWQALEDNALADAVTGELLKEIDDEMLWAIYQRQRTRVGMDLVRFLNVPSSDEISRYIQGQPEALRTFYRSHRRRYVRPERVVVRRILVALEPGASDEEIRTAKERAEHLSQRAREEGFAAIAEAHSDDLASRAKGGKMPPVGRDRLPLAFELAVGDISEVQRTESGFELYQVVKHVPAQNRKLDPALEREIASQLIQEAGAAPSILSVAEGVRQGFSAGDEEAVRTVLEANRHDVFHTELFPLGTEGRIPSVGYVPRVHAAVFSLTAEAPVSEPILDGEYVYIARLREREDADRLRFTADKDQFRAQYELEERGRILDRFLDGRVGASPFVDQRLLQREYGLLRKDGSVSGIE